MHDVGPTIAPDHSATRAVINSAQFSPRGDFIVTASADRTARVWDAKPGQPLPWRCGMRARVDRAVEPQRRLDRHGFRR